MRYWLGPWIWDAATLPGGAWRPPPHTRANLDLRAISEQSQRVVASHRGLFLTDDPFDLGPGYLELPPIFTPAMQGQIQTRIGHLRRVRSRTPSEFILECLTRLSDPDGVDFAKPLMPDHTGVLRYRFDVEPYAHQLRDTDPHFRKVVRVLRQRYRDLRRHVLAGLEAPGAHRRALSVWAEQLNVRDTAIFIPAGLPIETPLPHDTQLFDDFNMPDQTQIGHQQAWGEYFADGGGLFNADSWTNAANHARPTATPFWYALARPSPSLSTENHYVQCKVNPGIPPNEVGCAARVRKIGTPVEMFTFYSIHVQGTHHVLWKWVNAVATFLGGAPVTFFEPVLATVGADGSTIRSSTSDVPTADVTVEVVDTAITGYTMTQILGFQQDGTIWVDDFFAQDIVPLELCLQFAARQPGMTFTMIVC